MVVQIHRFTVVIVFPDLSFSVGGGRREILPPTYVQRRVGSSAGISICSGQGVALDHKAAAEKAFRCTLLLFVPRLVFISGEVVLAGRVPQAIAAPSSLRHCGMGLLIVRCLCGEAGLARRAA